MEDRLSRLQRLLFREGAEGHYLAQGGRQGLLAVGCAPPVELGNGKAVGAVQDLAPGSNPQKVAQDGDHAVVDERDGQREPHVDIRVEAHQVARFSNKGVAGVEQHD